MHNKKIKILYVWGVKGYSLTPMMIDGLKL